MCGWNCPNRYGFSYNFKTARCKFAHLVSDWFLHNEIRPSGGLKIEFGKQVGTTNKIALSVIELMENHIADLSLDQLSELNTVSKRQLNRIFVKFLKKVLRNIIEV